MKRVLIPLLLILLTNSPAWCFNVVVGQPAAAAVTFERLGYESFNPSTSPAALSATIPAGTTFILVGAGSYKSGGIGLTSVDLNGTQSFTEIQDWSVTGNNNCAIAYLTSPSGTGSQTINVTWADTPSNSQVFAIYYKGVEGLGDSDKNAGSPASVTLDAAVGDIIVSVGFADAAIGWTNSTEINEVSADLYLSFAELTADGTSEQITCSGSYIAFCSVVLQPN